MSNGGIEKKIFDMLDNAIERNDFAGLGKKLSDTVDAALNETIRGTAAKAGGVIDAFGGNVRTAAAGAGGIVDNMMFMGGRPGGGRPGGGRPAGAGGRPGGGRPAGAGGRPPRQTPPPRPRQTPPPRPRQTPPPRRTPRPPVYGVPYVHVDVHTDTSTANTNTNETTTNTVETPQNEITTLVNKSAIKRIKKGPNWILVWFIAVVVLACSGIDFEVFMSLLLVAAIVAQYMQSKRKKERRTRMEGYADTAVRLGYIDVRNAARSAGVDEKVTLAELKMMIEKGVFLQGHIDDEGTMLFASDKLYNEYIYVQNERKRMEEWEQEQTEKKKSEESEPEHTDETEEERRVREALETGKSFIEHIRESNNLLPGEKISALLDETELIVTKIFARIKRRPELLPQVRKFIQYYLPQTEKLVAAYEQFDTQEIETEKVKKSKEDIENALQTINKAFYKLYDGLFDDEVTDVTSDILVLKTMLAQEGLMDSDIRKARDDNE